jgi:hypothetical protein
VSSIVVSGGGKSIVGSAVILALSVVLVKCSVVESDCDGVFTGSHVVCSTTADVETTTVASCVESNGMFSVGVTVFEETYVDVST